jgi:hypothetical protein
MRDGIIHFTIRYKAIASSSIPDQTIGGKLLQRFRCRPMTEKTVPGLRLFKNGLLVGVGYLLSPLSWWNDLFFNFPIAWAFGYGINGLHPGWFVPATITGYWLSNVLGMVMMHFRFESAEQPIGYVLSKKFLLGAP